MGALRFRVSRQVNTLSTYKASADAGLYVKSIQVDGRDVSRGPLRLDGRSRPLNITLTYGAPALRVRARDSNGNGVAGAHVSLWRVNPISALGAGNALYTTTDQSGFADFSGLAKDKYYVIAWEGLLTPALPDILNSFAYLNTSQPRWICLLDRFKT